jgi:hypothetical protein
MRTPIAATLAGIAVGSMIAVALVAGGALRVPIERDYTDASGEFLAAWEHSRSGTFVVDSEFRRTLADGRTLFSSSQLVQRPPDRILRQFGGIDGQIDGHPVICSTDQNDNYSCVEGSMTVPSGEDAVRRELDTFRSYFTTPDPPLYQVIRAPEADCFELIQQIAYPDPAYGRYAKMCFDPTTGAMRSLERRLEGGVVETLEAFAVRTEVTGNDFNLDQDDDFDLRMDLGDAGLDPSLGTTPPGSGQPAPNVDDPTRAPSPDVEDLVLLDNEDLVLAGSEAVRQGRAPDPYVTVLAQRLEAGEFSINDTVWRRADGSATGLAEPMVLDLLRRGYYAPTP